jgi:SAM-dependent methyltransferase
MNVSTIAYENGVETIKSRLYSTWTAGDYDHFSRYLESEALAFYQRLAAEPGSTLLDVACGSGQLALLAAREGVDATGIDIAENLIARARTRAAAEQLPACFEVADAEELPFRDGSFDFVVSMFGAMFAPRPYRIASELVRGCAPGGTIAMANWTPRGLIDQMFKVIHGYVGSTQAPSPLSWGDEASVEERFGAEVVELNLFRRNLLFRYPFSPSNAVHFLRRSFGPVNVAFASLDLLGRRALFRELESMWSDHNRAHGDCTVVEAEYLEVIGKRA